MPEFKYCPECGHLLPAGAAKCTHCGTTLARADQVARRRLLIFIIVGVDIVITLAVVAILLAMY